MKRFALLLIAMIAIGGGSSIYADSAITFSTLLNELVDLTQFSRFPEPFFTCKQFSSYDPRSSDKTILTDENWFANADRGHFLRMEERDGRQEWVMMDAEGPGAIVRIWSANPQDAGIIRIYLDNHPEPIIEMPLLDMLRGGVFPFVAPIAHFASAGWNSYLPIPYARHCKVTASNPNFYYHINYRTYSKGTSVQTFSMEIAQHNKEQLIRTAERLEHPDELVLSPDVVLKEIQIDRNIPSQNSLKQKISGPGAIYSFEVKVNAGDVEQALRQTVLEICFDGAKVPQVAVPLGDFFATAPGLNPFRSLPCGVKEKGYLYSHWVMPFRRNAVIRLRNFAAFPVHISAKIITGKYAWDERSMYFWAGWKAEYPIRTQPRQDWNFVQITGEGVFMGNMLHITNPVVDWWGEGDEKIYVDGETFPSHFGTGTEDYYGYAWGSPIPFTHAYHNQPRCDGPGNYGHTCVSRFHLIDKIPFTNSFQFDMEVWHWKDCEIAMAATSYWYAKPQSSSNLHLPVPTNLYIVSPPPLPGLKKVENVIEGENMGVTSFTGGKVEKQVSVEFGWSGARQLWWIDGKPGDKLVLSFYVPKSGKYDIRAALTKAPDYGIVRLTLNECSTPIVFDGYHETVIVAEPVSLAKMKLRKGHHALTVEIMGKHDQALPGYMFGLDYLQLLPQTQS